METVSLADFSDLHKLFSPHQLESFLTLYSLLFFRAEIAPIQVIRMFLIVDAFYVFLQVENLIYFKLWLDQHNCQNILPSGF